MEKIVAAVLLAAVLLAGCSPGSETKGTLTEVSEPEESAGGTVVPAPEAEEPEESVSFGRINGGIYENTYFGIGCELDSDWEFAAAEELAGLNGAAAEAIDDEELRRLMEKSGSVFDMYATASDGLFSMSVVIEKLNALYGIALTEETYMDASIAQLEQALGSMDGVSDVSIEKRTIVFAGEEHTAAHVGYNISPDGETKIPGYELIVCIKNGSCVAAVTMSTLTVDLTSEAAGLFYAIEK